MSNYEEIDMSLVALSEDTARLAKQLYVKLTVPAVRMEAVRKMSGMVRINLPDQGEDQTRLSKV